ncbi:hypothetical protein BDF22DRAFT_365307 [Syncephalis plumigaleata]|nr:hypothetical protein BDF22DRAFT_365307 [Syncephalis plumigaleata]
MIPFKSNSISKLLTYTLVVSSIINSAVGSGGLFKGWYQRFFPFEGRGFNVVDHLPTAGYSPIYAEGYYTPRWVGLIYSATISCGANDYIPTQILEHIKSIPANSDVAEIKKHFPTIWKEFTHEGKQCYILEDKCKKNIFLDSERLAKLPEQEKKNLFSQIINTMRYMNNKGWYLHRNFEHICYNSGTIVFSRLNRAISRSLAGFGGDRDDHISPEQVEEYSTKFLTMLVNTYAGLFNKNPESITAGLSWKYADLLLDPSGQGMSQSPPSFQERNRHQLVNDPSTYQVARQNRQQLRQALEQPHE